MGFGSILEWIVWRMDFIRNDVELERPWDIDWQLLDLAKANVFDLKTIGEQQCKDLERGEGASWTIT